MEEDIRRKGMLYFHHQRFGKKWRKVWCVLVAESRRSVARLEVYEHKHSSIKQSSTKRKPDYKQVIRLRECIRISDCDMGDCPKDCATFLLETSEKLYVFACLQSEVKDWIANLCQQAFPDVEASQRERCVYPEAASASHAREMQENSLYDTVEGVRDFLVIAVGTEAAVRCNLYGDYLLTPLQDCIVLKDVKTKEVLFKWPYCYVRKFGQDTLSFSFEAGRRCESGEGNFEFATHQGERLFNFVSASIQNLPKPSAPKPVSLDQTEQRRAEVSTTETYDDIIGCKPYEFLPEGKTQKPSKMLNPAWRNFSLSVTEPQSESQEIKINSEPNNEEPVYATVSKAQQKATSPTEPKLHWKNLREAFQQSTFLMDTLQADADISSELAISEDPYEEKERAEDYIDLLGDSIQQLAINDALQNTSAEAIYADPQDVQDSAEWHVSSEYDDPEEVMKANQSAHDGANHLAEQDFSTIWDMSETQATAAPSIPVPNSDVMYSVYDNFRLKRM